VLTIHDLGSLEHPEWYSLFVCYLVRLAHSGTTETRAARDNDLARFAREALALAPIEQSKVAVVYGGVGDSFHPQPADEIVRREPGIRTPHYLLSLLSHARIFAVYWRHSHHELRACPTTSGS
jgi:hypothetical protein